MKVLLVNVLPQPRYMMERIDIIPDLIPEEHIFSSFKACTDWVKENIRDKHVEIPAKDQMVTEK